jgi:ribosome-binding protein aMBF1 (putative translation factor)
LAIREREMSAKRAKSKGFELGKIRAHLSMDFAEAIEARLEAMGVSQAWLAKRLKKSRPWVSKMLHGTNLQLSTMVEVADAVGLRVKLVFEDSEPVVKIETATEPLGIEPIRPERIAQLVNESVTYDIGEPLANSELAA